MHYNLAQHLRAHREEIVHAWMAAVRQDPGVPSSDCLSDVELRDHLDGLLEHLAEIVSAEGRLDPEQNGAAEEASKHGEVRWSQRFRIEELLKEISILRSEFLAYFNDYLAKTPDATTEEILSLSQVVHRYWDVISIESVSRYVIERDEQTANTQRALELLNTALEQTNKQYELVDESRRRTLRTVAHEMANPLNALGLGLTYMHESDGPAERDDAWRHVTRTLDHLRTMVNQLLDFARTDTGNEPLKITEFSVRPLFDYLVAAFEPLAAAKDLDFRAEIADDVSAIRSDENKVQRIAVNLLSNAIKYCARGHVQLSIRGVSDEHWLIEVSDTGCGIPRDEIEKVFGEFQRLAAHADQPGLGLGLAIVRSLVARLGGTITVESAIGNGSKFSVTLPREHSGAA